MLKNLIFIGLAYYFYTDMQKKLQGAMDDRNSLLNILTPEQKAQLLQGVKNVSAAATQAVSAATTAMQNTQTPTAPTSIPLSGLNYRRY